jgi:hypothetical protein
MEFFSELVRPAPYMLMPIGDIQWSGKSGPTALDLLKRRIDLGTKLNARYIGLGDYIDAFSPSNRQRIRSAALYDTALDVIDEKAMDLVQEIYDLVLKYTKGKWVGLLSGHHFTELRNGDTTDMRLSEMLDAPFLGTCAYGRIVFQGMGEITLWAHHGCGGGMKASAPVTKLENLVPYWDADIFMVGHMTKLATAPVNRVYASWRGDVPHLLHRKICLVGCGGFSKGFIERSRQGRIPAGSYVEQRMLNPTTLGNPVIRIVPRMMTSEQIKGIKQRLWSPEITVEV